MDLRVLSGGAAKGLVSALRQSFRTETGVAIDGMYGAVGAMKERLLAGEACDVAILTGTLIDELTAAGYLVPGSGATLGRVRTGIAVRSGVPPPRVSDRASLRTALLEARAIYFPDPERATAGIHFASVLRQLDVRAEVAPYLRAYPNGAAAMLQLAQSGEACAIGCTQITEIRYTAGVTLVGPLPKEFELETVYAAAVCKNAANPARARQLVELLCGPASAALRTSGGFEC